MIVARSWKICIDRSYACLMGAIYIFCFLNTTNRRSAQKLKKYYSVTAAEDTVFILLWYVKTSPVLQNGSHPWIFGWVAIIYYITFISGVGAMILYYKKFHPTTIKAKENDSTVDIQYFDSNLDLVVLKNWRRGQEEERLNQIQLEASASISNTSSVSSNSDAFNYSIIQHFYTSTFQNYNKMIGN